MNPRSRGIVAGCLAAAAWPALGACTKTCVIPECVLPLEFTLVSRCWPDGHYRVKVTADGQSFEAELALPYTGGASSPEGVLFVQASNDRGLETVSMASAPADVVVEIFHEGTSLGAKSYPSIFYAEHEYGGDGCEPTTCLTARPGWYVDDAAEAELCRVKTADGLEGEPE